MISAVSVTYTDMYICILGFYSTHASHANMIYNFQRRMNFSLFLGIAFNSSQIANNSSFSARKSHASFPFGFLAATVRRFLLVEPNKLLFLFFSMHLNMRA